MTKHQAMLIYLGLVTAGLTVYGAVSQDWSGVPVSLGALMMEGSNHA
jgi:hypothetical protein